MGLRAIAGGVSVSSSGTSLTVPIAGGVGYLPIGLFSNTSNISTSGTTASSIIPVTGVGSVKLPSNFLTPGKVINLTIAGQIVTQPTQGTISYTIALGASTIVTTAANTPSPGLTAGFQVDVVITCLTAGAAGTVNVVTRLSYGNATTSTSLLAWAATTGVVVDTTAANTVAATTTNSVSGGTVFNVYECQLSAQF